MPESPRATTRSSKFPGMITAYDPNDIPVGGAQAQLNVQSKIEGTLRVRRGVRETSFESLTKENV